MFIVVLQGVGIGSQHLTLPPAKHYVTIRVCVCVRTASFLPHLYRAAAVMMLLGIKRFSYTQSAPPNTFAHPHLHLSTSFQSSHFILSLCECQLPHSGLMHCAGNVGEGVCEG